MNSDELADLRKEINEASLTEDLKQHYETNRDDISGDLSEDWSYDRDDDLGDAYGRDFAGGMPAGGMAGNLGDISGRTTKGMTDLRGEHGLPGHVQSYGEELEQGAPGALDSIGGIKGLGQKVDPRKVPGYSGKDLPTDVRSWGQTLQQGDPKGFKASGGFEELGHKFDAGEIDRGQIPRTRDDGYGDTAYNRDMTWEDLVGDSDPSFNRDPEDGLWESKSAVVRGWLIENLKPLKSDGYDPERVVKVLNERTEEESNSLMLTWFHENKKQLQKDGYDFDLIVDKLNEN